jgi:mono/diheme cytochrome c family protein
MLPVMAMLPVTAKAQQAQVDPFADPYKEFCAVCHGAAMEGAAQGVPLAGRALTHGDTVDAIAKSIADGFPQGRMPAFSSTMDPVKIRRIATRSRGSGNHRRCSASSARMSGPQALSSTTVNPCRW